MGYQNIKIRRKINQTVQEELKMKECKNNSFVSK